MERYTITDIYQDELGIDTSYNYINSVFQSFFSEATQ